MCFVHPLADRRNGTLYVGVTNDALRRVGEHRSRTGSVFTRKYGTTTLVRFEIHERSDEAIGSQKQIEGGNRARKIRPIETSNPDRQDVSGDAPFA